MKSFKFLALTAALSTISLSAMALDAKDQKAVCAENQAANVELVKKIKATEDQKEREAVLRNALKDSGNAVCLTDLLQGSDLYDQAVAILAEADDNIEPAAGPDNFDAPTDLGNTDPTNGGLENPNQVSQSNS